MRIVRLQARESLGLDNDGDTMPKVGQEKDEFPRQASKQCEMAEGRVPCHLFGRMRTSLQSENIHRASYRLSLTVLFLTHSLPIL